MTKNILKFVGIILFATAMVSSCQTNNQCDTATESLVKINFYTIDSIEQAVFVSPISVYGVGRSDSLLYENDSISSVSIPLSPNAETIGFVFDIGTYSDEILFEYKTSTYLESMDCGFIANYEINSVTYSTNIIDTIIILNNMVTIDNEEHIKLYFKNNNPN